MASKTRDPRGSDPHARGVPGPTPNLLDLGPADETGLFELEEASHLQAKIKVIGVGGSGGNALNTMIDSGLGGVEFIAANTDHQALAHNRAPLKLQLGGKLRARGARSRPPTLLEESDHLG